MKQPEFKITFHKRRSRDFMDPHPDYAVCLNGEQVGELTHNLTGYAGHLPTITGVKVDIGQVSMGAWNALKHRLNDEGARAIAACVNDNERVINAHHTWNNRVMRIFNGTDERYVLEEALMMAEKVFGPGGVPWLFCADAPLDTPLREVSPETIATFLMPFVHAGEEAGPFLYAIARGDRPHLSGRTRKALTAFAGIDDGDEVVKAAKSWFMVWAHSAYPESMGEMTERFLNDVQRMNVWAGPITGSQTADRRILALRLDDAISILRGATGRGKWDAPAATGTFPDAALPLLARVIKACDDMGEDSPLVRADQELVEVMRKTIQPTDAANRFN